MKRPERVEDYFAHIADAIERATGYVRPLPNFDAFLGNQQIQHAVVRNIEVSGEAATKIKKMAPDFIALRTQISWTQMRAMRDVVIHAAEAHSAPAGGGTAARQDRRACA